MHISVELKKVKEYAFAILCNRRQSAYVTQQQELFADPMFDRWARDFSRRHSDVITLTGKPVVIASTYDNALVALTFRRDLAQLIEDSGWKNGLACVFCFAEVGKKCFRDRSSVSVSELVSV